MDPVKLNFPHFGLVYEEELDKDFGKKVAKMAHGENLFGCIQCGNCSSACPLSNYMDHTPRQIIAMVRAGFRQKTLSSKTIWLCASCYNCTVECPKSIKITEVMYALKRLAMIDKIYPKNFPVPILTRTFYQEVKKNGRISETTLLLNYYLKYNIFKSFSYAGLALKLLKTGRLNLFEKKMKNVESLKNLLRKEK
jgi:quinone-modifying oxidoreductase, subunit QmoC